MKAPGSRLVLLVILFTLPVWSHESKSVGRITGSTEKASKPAGSETSLRDLPSLLVRWTWKGKPDAVFIQGEVAYVRSEGRILALRAKDGSVIWEKTLGPTECCAGEGPIFLGGDALVAFAEKLFVLDPASGDVKQTVTLSGRISKILGPPLLVVTNAGDWTVELQRIDQHLGQVTARRTIGRMVYDAAVRDGVIVLNVDESDGKSYDKTATVGLGADDLIERWRLPDRAFPRFEFIGDQLYLQVLTGETSHFAPLDVKSGTLGRPLPQRQPCEISSSDLPWDLEIVTETDDRSRATFRRNSVDTGQPVWTVDLSCAPGATLRREDELLVDCRRGAGRSVLTVLDWSSGKLLRRASGLRDVRGLRSYANLVIADVYDEGVVAFEAKQLGPQDAKLRSLRDDVHRILGIKSGDESPYGRGDHIGNAVADLQALGTEALTYIADEIPGLGTTSLVAAAHVLEEARYRRAAPLLATRLKGALEEPGVGWDHWNPQFAVLTALAKIGGPEEVPAVVSILADPNRKGTIRRQALSTLASIETPTAVAAIERTLTSPPRKPISWWSPPSPEAFARYVGLPDLKQRAEKALHGADASEWSRLERASESIRIARANGHSLLIFPDAYLGGPGDLWLAETDATGKPTGPARFTGVSIHTPGQLRGEEIAISAELHGDILTIHRLNGDGKSYEIALSALDKDSDGDGLTDIVERRLRTDPAKADTDGDGVKDSEDLAPNAKISEPVGEQQAIALEIFRQFFMFEPPETTRELAIVESDGALKWTGRSGPTITLSADANTTFLEEAGYDGIAHIHITPLDPKRKAEDDDFDRYHFEGELRANERLYALDLYRGGLNAIGHRVIVRKIGRRWVITELQVAYVS